jgi:uncharacterized SAM-binding protein YcdF (DUF218 family)
MINMNKTAPHEAPKKNVIIVLGAGTHSDGTLFDGSKANVRKAVELFRRDEHQPIIFTGKWNPSTTPQPPLPEARAMTEYATTLGFPQGKAIEETDALDTVGSAYYTNKIVLRMPDVGSITVVAAAWHVPRATFIFTKVFGGVRFPLKFEAGNVVVPDPEKMRVNEEQKIAFLRGIYGLLRDGDYEGFAHLVEKQHPYYALDENKIPETAWTQGRPTTPTITYIQ